jgi:hypothetical protein
MNISWTHVYMVRKLEVDVDEEVLNVHFQIFNPKEIENIKAKG